MPRQSISEEPNIAHIRALFEQQEQDIQRLLNQPLVLQPIVDEFVNDPLFRSYRDTNSFLQFTGLPALDIIDIARDLQRIQPIFGRRGPVPVISLMDSFVAYLTMFKSRGDY